MNQTEARRELESAVKRYAPLLLTQEATRICLDALANVFAQTEHYKIFEGVEVFLNERGGYVDLDED